MKKRQEYQKENARILVSRSCASDQLIELGVRGGGGGEGMGYKRVGNGSVPHMEINHKNNLVNLMSQV